MRKFIWAAFILLPFVVKAQSRQGKFEQLGELLPTPKSYRTASGVRIRKVFEKGLILLISWFSRSCIRYSLSF